MRHARGCLAVVTAAAILLAPTVSPAQQLPPPPSFLGAVLRLSEIGCARPDAQSLESFALAAQLEVVKQGATQAFPEEALRERLGGTVTLHLTYAANQERPVIDVERSSGHAVLDRHAVALAQGADLRPPDALRCRSFDIAFPLRFRVQSAPPGRP